METWLKQKTLFIEKSVSPSAGSQPATVHDTMRLQVWHCPDGFVELFVEKR